MHGYKCRSCCGGTYCDFSRCASGTRLADVMADAATCDVAIDVVEVMSVHGDSLKRVRHCASSVVVILNDGWVILKGSPNPPSTHPAHLA